MTATMLVKPQWLYVVQQQFNLNNASRVAIIVLQPIYLKLGHYCLLELHLVVLANSPFSLKIVLTNIKFVAKFSNK